MNKKTIYILWDESHIWGLMVWRAARAFGLPCRLVKAKEISQGGLLGKHSGPAALVVPGGSARQKAAALGHAGREAIRAWVGNGGFYLGFCGGAGLALAGESKESLGLCPWPRAPYNTRLRHLLTGHVRARLEDGGIIEVPVWWPGRFAPAGGAVRVLARYAGPGCDLWLADLPLSRLPKSVPRVWREELGFAPEVDFPADMPLSIHGSFGHGGYLLSYAHLETPASADANIWLAKLLRELAAIDAKKQPVPAWNTASKDGICAGSRFAKAHASMAALMDTAEELRIFFPRTAWLQGWRSGISGMACNNLLAALFMAAQLLPTNASRAFWDRGGEQFTADLEEFIAASREFFWTARLARTLEPVESVKIAERMADLNASLLGHPMLGGAKARELLDFVEEYVYLAQPEA